LQCAVAGRAVGARTPVSLTNRADALASDLAILLPEIAE
jgi:hypothetical protein